MLLQLRSSKRYRLAGYKLRWKESGGERGIRTPGTLSGTTVFKTAGFNRSPSSPLLWASFDCKASRPFFVNTGWPEFALILWQKQYFHPGSGIFLMEYLFSCGLEVFRFRIRYIRKRLRITVC
jgi:hypothetical protein